MQKRTPKPTGSPHPTSSPARQPSSSTPQPPRPQATQEGPCGTQPQTELSQPPQPPPPSTSAPSMGATCKPDSTPAVQSQAQLPPSYPGPPRHEAPAGGRPPGVEPQVSTPAVQNPRDPDPTQPPQTGTQERARELTSLLARRLDEQLQQQAAAEEQQQRFLARRAQSGLGALSTSTSRRSSLRTHSTTATTGPPGGAANTNTTSSTRRRGGPASSLTGSTSISCKGGEGAGGLGEEVEALLGGYGAAGGGGGGGGVNRFQALLRDLMDSAQTQLLLPGDTHTEEDAAALQAAAGCTADQAARLLDCLAVVRAAADSLAPPAASTLDPDVVDLETEADGAGRTSGTGGGGAAGAAPGPQQLTRQLGFLAGLVNEAPGLRTAAMARDAAAHLLRILTHHPEKAAAANAALVLGALAAGPHPHKTTLVAAGVVDGLLQAARGRTAAAEAAGGDAPVVTANACSALGNLSIGHAAGAAAIAASPGGIDTLISLLAVSNAPNVRTNAAGVLVQLMGAHESYRAAVVAAGGVPALAAGMLRGPDAAACNSVTALYNLAALTPPSVRPAMSEAGGSLAVVPQLLLCMAGRNIRGEADESVAASTSARVNASAVLLELCKDPAAAPLLADAALAVPAALAALTAGRLPPLPPLPSASPAPPPTPPSSDLLSGGVDLLYPVPPVVRGNCLLCMMALARMGSTMQLELGRCGAVGTLLELLESGQDPAMQINSANALCSLAAANSDIHSALVASRCVPLLAGLLIRGGDAARANVAAVLVTMMKDEEARSQIQECGALSSLVRLVCMLLDERSASGGGSPPSPSPSPSPDPGGVLCNTVGALAEAAKYPELRRSLMQVEFGESLGALLRCLKEAPEPAQVNAAAALCHLCREQSAAVQLGRLRGVELLKLVTRQHPGPRARYPHPVPSAHMSEAVGARPDDWGGGSPGPGSGCSPTSWTRPSSRLRHNASRALARLQEQLTAMDEQVQAAAVARAAGRASATGTAAAAAGDIEVDEAPYALRGLSHDVLGGGSMAAAGGPDRRSDPPRAAWGLVDAEALAAEVEDEAAAIPRSALSRTFESVRSYKSYKDDDSDSLSVVITPPLPLAAY
ncbi:hypothetical protein VOLCADRAFT_95541 [Volvox carteri f. nagariensis]|uniref:Uncharacterized protein n=1 Tax=Volvox carteri f. nagariensis TaxID=3068 RepID=D8U7R4_VOLCA|nr:uncharacterized protein VOLCADRAFT_95541 [Volvox carteri f. nagariensis]EFJ44279.1 hypothetical protein VOLCADRAFT_95541 [Volvox carteri f. nagariensis]|eukprot:XP_002954638.1 hypothetical protein VOLCADRAFT_95541 [Volvox carteri f. nagariensis]